MSDGKKVARLCVVCNQPYNARLRDVKRGQKSNRPLGLTCSRTCANSLKARRPKQTLSGRKRKEVRETWGWKCAQCETLHTRFQTIIVKSPIPDFDFIPLCQSCANRMAAKALQFNPRKKEILIDE